MPTDPPDPPSDDEFFEPLDHERINAFEIDEHTGPGGYLEEHGYGPGDAFPVQWQDQTGADYETTINLPTGAWGNPDTWGDFYDEMRDWFEDIWGDGDSPEGGAATGG